MMKKTIMTMLAMIPIAMFSLSLSAMLSDEEKMSLENEYRINVQEENVTFIQWLMSMLAADEEKGEEKICHLYNETKEWGMMGRNSFTNRGNLSTIAENLGCEDTDED